MTTKISSSQQWRQVTSANSIVVTDFYADWCGPCKMIAPTFESLANKYAKPNRIAFAKVDVDNQRDIAQQYGVRAMPTFVILRNGSVHETIQGANPPALTAAVEKAVKLATGGGSTFSTPGRTLGSDEPKTASSSSSAGIRIGGGPSRPSGNPIQGHRSWFDPMRIINWLISFIGLYLTSLFSLDPYMAAQNSKYNKGRPPANEGRFSSGAPFGGRTFANPAGQGVCGAMAATRGGVDRSTGSTGSNSGSGAQQRGGFRTLADLGSD
ncbi:hypothetical protein SBRCBS47491_002388 [Sporothrix bragantina]|uniref:Thioredoxin domain-containing protein n=1 Tax=Sporothrix bragantina TaxID=671064 RepID=A0ABP0B6C7_9PEZI